MRLKTLLPLVVVSVIGIVFTTLFSGNVLLSQSIRPFSSINTADPLSTPGNSADPDLVVIDTGSGNVSFANQDLISGWIPWVIQQVSILIGALSLCVFVYAGVNLIIKGDNEEELGKSTKMIIFGVVGIALSGLSYTIVANVLALF